ncbi:ABC transporter permease [Labilibaculum sp. DW002]|uniref:ABC transporter permease n=1 Tax=Paralabilibaculum antarcticum TaxID=2912572 RepID=A0ABT5VSS2_9BACT|nr:ABC transporter permease [Labilibaculum sp. DW002]MDE5417344.1 ABC transporter permease [Labilibaculum sp. DW002]
MFNLALKDIQQYFKDKTAVFLSLLLPIALMTIFALMYGGIGGSKESKPITLLFTDQDNTEISKEVYTTLNKEDGLNLIAKTLPEAEMLVKKGKNSAVLVLYKGFQDSVEAGNKAPMELFYDEAKEIEVGLLQQALWSNLFGITMKRSMKGKVNSFIKEKNPKLSDSEIIDIQEQVASQFGEFEASDDSTELEENSNLPMTALIGEEKNGNLGLVQAIAGMAIMMLLFSVSASGASLLKEKEEGTLRRLLVAPISPQSILYGKMLSTLFLAILQLTVMFLYSWLALGLDIFINLPALILMILSSAIACSSFGIFMASVCKSRKQVESLSTLIILVISALGGSMMPMFFMPAIMQKIAVISVNYWAMDGFFDIFWRQLPISEIYPKMLVLLGIGALLTTISVISFKRNLLKMV